MDKDRILAVIDRDAQIRRQYWKLRKDGTVRYCIIGGLMEEAGLAVTETVTPQENKDTINHLAKIMDFLMTEFDVSKDFLEDLQHINDRYERRPARQRALREFVESQ